MGEAYNLVVSICLNVLKGVKKKLYENVDAQKEPSRHLRAPVQGRCDGRQEGSLCAQASGIGERSQPPRHQSLPISQVQGNGHETVRLETLLLVPDQRGYPVLARLPPPSPRDRAGDVETRHAPRAPEASGINTDAAETRPATLVLARLKASSSAVDSGAASQRPLNNFLLITSAMI